jgi:hypothetical protein
MARDHSTVRHRDLTRVVAGAVVHDEDRGLDAAHLIGNPVEDPRDAVRLVVGGDQHADLVPELLRVAVHPELLPREALQDARQLASDPRSLRQRADDEQEEDQDREDRHADDPRPVRALEREGAEDRVEQLGPRDDGHAGRDSEQDDHVDVAKRPAPQDRERRDRGRGREPGDPDGGQLRRKQIRLQEDGFHGRKRIDGAHPVIRACSFTPIPP